MSNLRRCSISFIAIALSVASCLAQSTEGSKFYKLEFTVKEMEGTRALSSRSYSMVTIAEVANSSIRAGSKVPIPASPGSTQQFTFIELGVNIDCRAIKEVQNELSLNITADISSTGEATAPAYPIIRQNKWSSTVIVPLRKPTLIFSSDDVTTKRQIQLELTATPIK